MSDAGHLSEDSSAWSTQVQGINHELATSDHIGVNAKEGGRFLELNRYEDVNLQWKGVSAHAYPGHN